MIEKARREEGGGSVVTSLPELELTPVSGCGHCVLTPSVEHAHRMEEAKRKQTVCSDASLSGWLGQRRAPKAQRRWWDGGAAITVAVGARGESERERAQMTGRGEAGAAVVSRGRLGAAAASHGRYAATVACRLATVAPALPSHARGRGEGESGCARRLVRLCGARSEAAARWRPCPLLFFKKNSFLNCFQTQF